MSEPHLPLFVYGTLRRGEENHHYLEGRYVRSIPAELYGYARVGPLMIRQEPGGRVDGELYFLQLDGYAETMANCDQLEELIPGRLVGKDYQRKVVTVRTAEGPFQAWAYVQPEP
jgi:gamma-glutamylcyclotransferase (GGCT)/AIG2-like uncharacterized protein YtfP